MALTKEQSLFLVDFLSDITDKQKKFIKSKMLDETSDLQSIEVELDVSKKLNEIILELKST